MTKETIDKILYACCGFRHGSPYLESPVYYKDKAYSTDANICVAIKTGNPGLNVISDEIGNNLTRPLNFKQTQYLKIDVPKMMDLFCHMDRETDLVTTKDADVCKECNGSGEVDWEYKHYTSEFECPVCDGRGDMNNPIRSPTGFLKYPSSEFIRFKEAAYSAKYIGLICQIAQLLEQDSIFLLDESGVHGPAHFKIEDVDFTLMPCRIDEHDELRVINYIS